ncbi:hypothetical protein BDU57DRAFT_26106 [Ampelomyces quisqualis]|uniref:Uncharacterized protein n=1 Tax=Ampelomyces quisqualis TaxID=50730 RepID=A0A6A5R201_AMPQU|nr:hypothetical protein BDU57DRAFT_26106 [Ampelomyces quisqualis]
MGVQRTTLGVCCVCASGATCWVVLCLTGWSSLCCLMSTMMAQTCVTHQLVCCNVKSHVLWSVDWQEPGREQTLTWSKHFSCPFVQWTSHRRTHATASSDPVSTEIGGTSSDCGQMVGPSITIRGANHSFVDGHSLGSLNISIPRSLSSSST